jgi:hypothetical protein
LVDLIAGAHACGDGLLIDDAVVLLTVMFLHESLNAVEAAALPVQRLKELVSHLQQCP